MNVVEFRHVEDLNEYLAVLHKRVIKIIPLERRFENPKTKLLTSFVAYILVEAEV